MASAFKVVAPHASSAVFDSKPAALPSNKAGGTPSALTMPFSGAASSSAGIVAAAAIEAVSHATLWSAAAIKSSCHFGHASVSQTIRGRIIANLQSGGSINALRSLEEIPDKQRTGMLRDLHALLQTARDKATIMKCDQALLLCKAVIDQYYSEVGSIVCSMPKDQQCEFNSVFKKLNDSATLTAECVRRKWPAASALIRSGIFKIQTLIAWENYCCIQATKELNKLQTHLTSIGGAYDLLSSTIAAQLVAISPHLQPLRSLDLLEPPSGIIVAELEQRAVLLYRLLSSMEKLKAKYSSVKSALEDPSHKLSSLLRSIRLHMMLMPAIDLASTAADGLLISKIEWLSCFIDELITNKYGPEAAFFLERALTKCALAPSKTEIADKVALRTLKAQFTKDLLAGTLARAPESLFKDVFIVSAEGLKAKYKPLEPSSMRCETVCCAYDRLAHIGITQSIRHVHYTDHISAMDRLKDLYTRGSVEDIATASEYFTSLPDSVKNAIYGATYALFGERRDVWDYGKDLWLGNTLTLENRLSVVQSMYRWGRGVLQLWIPGVMYRAYDMLKWDDGIAKFKAIPNVLVHFHVLSGLIKGSRDNASGNTIFTLSDDYSGVTGVKEFDDELSLPSHGTYKDIRLWQLGLPQSAAPFDRATLMLFVQLDWIAHIESYNKLSKVPESVQAEQRRRLLEMVRLFNAELRKETIALTPRDLFFHICGGREEYTTLVAAGISPWEIFERELSDSREIPFVPEPEHVARVRANLTALYS